MWLWYACVSHWSVLSAARRCGFPPYHQSNAHDNDEGSVHIDPDDEVLDEDVNVEGLNFHEEAALYDVDEQRRRTRQKRYEDERDKLIKDKHTITKTMGNTSSLDIGAKIATRKKDPKR